MPKIIIETFIKANKDIVFDVSRSVELHQLSTRKTDETAIAGKTSGLMELNETVTWRAKHLGVYQNLTATITAFQKPTYFSDEMVKGAFKRFKHEHFFDDCEGGTLMKDVFDYESPLGPLGKLADFLFLKKYMTRFLLFRNNTIRQVVENGSYTKFLNR